MTAGIVNNPWSQIGAPAIPETASENLSQSVYERLSLEQVRGLFGIAGTAVETAGAHYNASAAHNVSAINAALSRRGLVTFTTPGQYLIGGPGQDGLLIHSDTTLFVGRGVELILADSTYMPLIRNASAFLPGMALGVVVQWETVADIGSFVCTITKTGIGLQYPLGSKFGLLGLPGTSGNNREFQGVWRVARAEPNKIYFQLGQQPPSGNASQNTGVIYPADDNIIIIGGMWDGNKAGQQGGGLKAGEPKSHILAWRNCQGVGIANIGLRKGHSWAIGTNNIRDMIVRDINADLSDGPTSTAQAVIQCAGGVRNILVENIVADCSDNIVAFSLDVMGTGVGQTSYDHYDPGDTYDVTVRNVSGRATNAALVAMWGNINYMHHNTLIENVTGTCPQPAVQVFGGYAPTQMNNTNGGQLIVRNVRGSFGTAVALKTEGVWDHISVENVRNENTGGLAPLVNVYRNTADSITTQSIKKLDIKNVMTQPHNSTINRTGPAVQITDSNIDDLRIEGVNGMRLAANVSLILFSGSTGIVKQAVVQGADAISSASGDSFIVSCENTSPTALGQLTVRDATMTGTGGTGGIVRQSLTGKVTKIIVDPTCVQTGGEGVVVRDGTGAALHTITATVS